jgi:hypothetical protein
VLSVSLLASAGLTIIVPVSLLRHANCSRQVSLAARDGERLLIMGRMARITVKGHWRIFLDFSC